MSTSAGCAHITLLSRRPSAYAYGCSYRSPSIRVDRTEVEKCRMAHWNPSVAVRTGRRRIEGDQEPKQPFASRRACFASASSLARTHTVSLGGRLDLCKSALSRQDSVHLPDSLPPSHPSRDRENRRDQEQQGSTDRMAHTAPVPSDSADLDRGECKGGTITTTSHHTEDYPGALRPSGFIRPAGGPQESCQNGSSRRIRREVEGEACQGNCLRRGISAALGVRGCPKSTLPKSAKCFGILVSAAGFEPATHALKGHCSTN
jgi:hypothetical protein